MTQYIKKRHFDIKSLTIFVDKRRKKNKFVVILGLSWTRGFSKRIIDIKYLTELNFETKTHNEENFLFSPGDRGFLCTYILRRCNEGLVFIYSLDSNKLEPCIQLQM